MFPPLIRRDLSWDYNTPPMMLPGKASVSIRENIPYRLLSGGTSPIMLPSRESAIIRRNIPSFGVKGFRVSGSLTMQRSCSRGEGGELRASGLGFQALGFRV